MFASAFHMPNGHQNELQSTMYLISLPSLDQTGNPNETSIKQESPAGMEIQHGRFNRPL
jgi:hypothetical protein